MSNQVEMVWAILPSAIPAVVRLLSGQTADFSNSLPSPMPSRKSVAIIPIRGVLTNNGPAHYGSNYHGIAAAAEKAANDPDVQRIVLSVDSPGGEVSGLPEVASVLSQVARIKPVSAIVEGVSASAAYWLTSQAHDITLTPSGEVGSVGVRMMHIDASKMLEDLGYKVTELYSGNFKTEWSPYKPLSEGAKADMQARLSATHAEFLGAVARGRGGRVSPAIAKARFGEGRMFSANDALSHGLVDKIQAPRDFYRAVVPARVSSVGISPRRARLELERLKG